MTVLFCCCAPRQPSLAKAAALRLPVFAFKYYHKIVQGWQKQPSFFASFFVFKNPATFYAVQLNQGGSASALSLSWINCWIEPNQSTNQNQSCLVGRPAPPEVEADRLAERPHLLAGAEFFSLLRSVKLFQKIKNFTVFLYLYLKLCLMKIINKFKA